MNQLTTHLNTIIKKNGGSPSEWKDTAAIINSRPDE